MRPKTPSDSSSAVAPANGQRPLFLALSGFAAVLLGMGGDASASCGAPSRPEAPVRIEDPSDRSLALDLAQGIDLAPQSFRLANGLKVVVHSDHSSPLVGIAVWYGVGSGAEPAGSAGLAHLFEHLMFKGSENVPRNFFGELTELGATDFDGVTTVDTTRYFETLPSSNLERALFLESERMGHFLGAVTEASLREQIGVVKNEKLEREGRPYGLVRDHIRAAVFGAGHPYSHSSLGLAADLDQTTLASVHAWFRRHYGPQNAVLVLTGDIDAATARRLAQQYFGDIAAGSASRQSAVPIPSLPEPVFDTLTDRVAQTMLTQSWATPGRTDPDAVALDLAAAILGALSTSSLMTDLQGSGGPADRVSVRNEVDALAGVFTIEIGLKPGSDPQGASRAITNVLRRFVEDGPTVDELERAKVLLITRALRNMDSLGGFAGRAVVLAEGASLAGDAQFYRNQLAAIAAQTPSSVREVARRWLTRPVYQLTVSPGPRAAQEPHPTPVTLLPADQVPAIRPSAPRTAPSLGRAPDPRFPRVEHGILRNGIVVAYAHDPNAPMTRLLVSFDGGLAAEGEAYGIQRLTLNAMLASSEGMDTAEVGRAKERLGASIETVVQSDASSIVIQAPSGGLLPTMELLSDLLQRPAFPDADVERLREEQLADIGQEVSNPTRAAQRVMAEAIGRGTPYQSYSDLGSRGSVSSFTAADLRAFRSNWYQPGATRIFVISDLPFAVVHDRIDAQLGDWRSSAVPGRVLSSQGRPPVGRVLLIDRPGAPQTSVVLGIPTTMRGDGDLVALLMADEALGESGTSRINLDIRETNNWSYGARGGFQLNRTFVPYVLRAAVQADRTGDVMDAMRRHVSAFTTTEPMTQAEFEFVIESTIRKLPGKYETPMSRLYAMQSNTLAGRPDTYVADLAARYRALRLPDLQKAISDALDLEKAFWVVTGDASVIEPQIRLLGLPVEAITPNE